MCEKCLYVSWRRGYKTKAIRDHFPNQTKHLSDDQIKAAFGAVLNKNLLTN